MTFEKFEKHRLNRANASISIHPGHQIYLNVRLREILGDPQCVAVHLDVDNGLIGFEPAELGDEDSYMMTTGKMGGTRILRALDYDEPEDGIDKYSVVVDDDDYDFPYADVSPGINETLAEAEDPSIPQHVILATSSKTQRSVHAPANNSTLDNPLVHCSTATPDNGWVAKEREKVPSGFYERCSSCENRLEKMRKR